MAPSSRDRISVDMRGFRTALFEQARARGVSPSAFVRHTLACSLEANNTAGTQSSAAIDTRSTPSRVRLSLRLNREEADAVLSAAGAAGLPVGAYIAGLALGIPLLARGASRPDHLAALVASSAELSTLSRDIRHLTSLLRQGNVRPAMEYRAMLDTLAGDVRGHLTLAASVLADLRPRHRSADSSTHPTT